MDSGKPFNYQYAIQYLFDNLELGYSSAMKDLNVRKDKYDGILTSRDFSNVRAYFIEFNSVVPVMCSGGFYPIQDFEGNKLQDLADLTRTPHLITVTSFYGGNSGLVVLSWLQEDDPSCLPFVESLHRIGDRAVTDALLRLLFSQFENIQIQPQWWEALSKDSQRKLIEKFNSSINPFEEWVKGYLSDDRLTLDVWPVDQRRLVGFQL
jgi:hypothetical protein